MPYSGGLSGSATFDGISISLTNTNNDYVQLPSGMAASLSNLGAWSFTAWIKGATTVSGTPLPLPRLPPALGR